MTTTNQPQPPTNKPAKPPAAKPIILPEVAPSRALSVAEPWAYLITAGFKPIENRIWHTSYRGTIAIHASKSTVYLAPPAADANEAFRLHPAIWAAVDDSRIDEDHLIFQPGAVIGTVDIVDCVAFDAETEDPDIVFERYQHITAGTPFAELPIGAWAQGPYCFILANPRRFVQPIACPGKLSLWGVDGKLRDAIAKQSRLVYRDPGQPPQSPVPLDGPPPTERGRREEIKALQSKAEKRAAKLGQQLPTR